MNLMPEYLSKNIIIKLLTHDNDLQSGRECYFPGNQRTS